MWDEGYTSEVNYTSGYYSELSPNLIKFALLACGIDHGIAESPDYLELGFGQGLSLNIHAATNPGQFCGNDFNPGQVVNAREMASAMGKPLALFEDSFEELASRCDLPEFDVIALHGIWSWVSAKSRAAIVEIARKSLKPGGVLYISYNVMPGWSPAWPMRMLLAEHARREGAGTLFDKVDQALDFVEQMMGANAAYFEQNPRLAARLELMKKQDRAYLAHEFFNADWDPMPFARVAEQLGEAKLTFAGSASVLDNLPVFSIPAAAQPILQAIKDPIMRQTARDFFVSQQFRRDLFVKGPRTITSPDYARRTARQRFVLLGDPQVPPAKVTTSIGDVDLRADLVRLVTQVLAASPDGMASLAELAASPELGEFGRAQIWDMLVVLTGAGYVAPLSASSTADRDAAASKSLNALLLDRAEAGCGVDYLAAPRLGTGIAVTRIEQLFMRALEAKQKDPAGWVGKLLADQNELLIVEGETIKDAARTLAELGRMYAEFKGRKAALLKRLGAC